MDIQIYCIHFVLWPIFLYFLKHFFFQSPLLKSFQRRNISVYVIWWVLARWITTLPTGSNCVGATSWPLQSFYRVQKSIYEVIYSSSSEIIIQPGSYFFRKYISSSFGNQTNIGSAFQGSVVGLDSSRGLGLFRKASMRKTWNTSGTSLAVLKKKSLSMQKKLQVVRINELPLLLSASSKVFPRLKQ